MNKSRKISPTRHVLNESIVDLVGPALHGKNIMAFVHKTLFNFIMLFVMREQIVHRAHLALKTIINFAAETQLVTYILNVSTVKSSF